jgi:Tol biopolymer transport system component
MRVPLRCSVLLCAAAAACDGAGPGDLEPLRNQIVFTSGQTVPGVAVLHTMNPDGTGIQALPRARNEDMSWPAVSPDGRRIAFSQLGDIWVVNADGSGEIRLTQSGAQDTRPGWSPDGEWIAFETDRDGNGEIYVMRPNGTGVRNVTNDPRNERGPAWSPDGQRIAFSSLEAGANLEIATITINGADRVILTDNPDGDSSPAWSPDGRRIAFSSTRDFTTGIYLMDADGGNLVALPGAGINAYSPAWSPDGSRIAFECFETGFRLCVIGADGTGLVDLTTGFAPSWSP